jgi:predicted negative regulator of RcsB-dependent stress response
MSAQSLFSKKNIQSQQPDTRTGIMEELNLPPEVISFIRKHSRNLQIALVAVVVLVLAWVFYGYYSDKQERDAASLLATAMQAEATDEQIQLLDKVISDYSGTDGALWSRLELAHIDFQEGRFEEAIAEYEKILGEISADNSLVPLVKMNLAQSYENVVQYDQAITQYSKLKVSSGFAGEAYLSLGRIYTAKGEPEMARKEYEELLSSMGDEIDPQLKSSIQALIVSVGGQETAPAQPEEAKE